MSLDIDVKIVLGDICRNAIYMVFFAYFIHFYLEHFIEH